MQRGTRETAYVTLEPLVREAKTKVAGYMELIDDKIKCVSSIVQFDGLDASG
jgi:hypothetical protein